jgi:hypothetical protein
MQGSGTAVEYVMVKQSNTDVEYVMVKQSSTDGNSNSGGEGCKGLHLLKACFPKSG